MYHFIVRILVKNDWMVLGHIKKRSPNITSHHFHEIYNMLSQLSITTEYHSYVDVTKNGLTLNYMKQDNNN